MTDAQRMALDEFLASACDGLEDERTAAQAQPDLADAVARAHALDPVAVPRAWTHAARVLPPLASDPAPGSATPQTSAELRFFLDEVRGLLDEQVASAAPPVAAAPPGRARGRWAVALVAAAAIVLLGLGLGVASSRWLARSDAQEVPREVAGDVVDARETRELSRAPEHAPIAELPAATPLPSPLPSPAAPPVVRSSPRRGPAAAAPAAAPAAVEPTLEELEREAQRRWQQGDLAGARERFETIAARAGRSSMAELALGDLIALALRSKDPGRVRTAWSKYLARFPRGRYADDARAGLCRTAAADKQRACWQEYLDDWPAGAHRGEARGPSTP